MAAVAWSPRTGTFEWTRRICSSNYARNERVLCIQKVALRSWYCSTAISRATQLLCLYWEEEVSCYDSIREEILSDDIPRSWQVYRVDWSYPGEYTNIYHVDFDHTGWIHGCGLVIIIHPQCSCLCITNYKEQFDYVLWMIMLKSRYLLYSLYDCTDGATVLGCDRFWNEHALYVIMWGQKGYSSLGEKEVWDRKDKYLSLSASKAYRLHIALYTVM